MQINQEQLEIKDSNGKLVSTPEIENLKTQIIKLSGTIPEISILTKDYLLKNIDTVREISQETPQGKYIKELLESDFLFSVTVKDGPHSGTIAVVKETEITKNGKMKIEYSHNREPQAQKFLDGMVSNIVAVYMCEAQLRSEVSKELSKSR